MKQMQIPVYIRSGENKRQLNERWEHRRSILNHHQLSDPTPVSLHFNQSGRSINEVRRLIPLVEFIRSNHDAVRKTREALLIRKEKTFSPQE